MPPYNEYPVDDIDDDALSHRYVVVHRGLIIGGFDHDGIIGQDDYVFFKNEIRQITRVNGLIGFEEMKYVVVVSDAIENS